MAKIPLSVCIVARNEEEVIEECLRNVYGWADEIIVVNGESSDRTAQIAKKYATVFTRKNDPSHHVNKKWSFDKARNRWILSLDADESLDPELKKEIERVVKEDGYGYNGFMMPRKQILYGKPLKYDWKGYQLRLYKKGKEYFKGEKLHEYIMIDGKVGTLRGYLMHFGWWRGMHAYVYKMNNYTTFDAQSMVDRGESYSFGTLVKKIFSQGVQLTKSRIVFNRFPYGLFFLFGDIANECMLFFKFREFKNNKKRNTDDVNRYA